MATNVTAIDPLESLRKALTPAERKIVRAVMSGIERKFIDALPEVQAGVESSGAQGSFTATMAILKGKRDRFAGRLTTRVRTPSEPIEFDFHIDTSGQLALGLPPGWDGDDGPE
jgi:hypothetical protein